MPDSASVKEVSDWAQANSVQYLESYFHASVPGILAGVILAIGRIVGETAALIYTAGTMATVPKNLLSSGRTLAVHMYVLSSEGLHMNQAFATAVILLLVLLINILSSVMIRGTKIYDYETKVTGNVFAKAI